jgi:hypothetical protein
MSPVDDIIARQRAWAVSRELIDTEGYLPTVEANLRADLSPAAQLAFERGDGAELKDSRTRLAKMRALHSSSALVVNVFDYWPTRDTTRLGAALGFNSGIQSIEFEAQFPTGLDGNPPNLDLALVLSEGITVGIESKFTEWLHAKSPQRAAFKPKYFPKANGLWESRGLRQSQALAQAMSDGVKLYRYLDAAQLLKHALGLATQLAGKFALLYVHLDWPCPEADLHRSEIQDFSSLVGSELRFRALTYQEVYKRLSTRADPVDEEYLAYLGGRYFTEGRTEA